MRKEWISTRWLQLFSGVRLPLIVLAFCLSCSRAGKQRTGFVVVETSSAYREPLLFLVSSFPRLLLTEAECISSMLERSIL